MDERTGSQEDLVFTGINGASRWSDWRSWSRKQKLFAAFSVLFSFIVFAGVILVIATYGSSKAVIPPTPTPTPTPTTSTPTTTTSTTTKPTTTTPTTTTPTTTPTTTTTPATTTPTTTKPTTPTTTSTPPPTTPTTTTQPTPPPTTHAPFPPPTTLKPLPPNITELPPLNVLHDYLRLDTSYVNIGCQASVPPVFRQGVHIAQYNYTWFGESDTKKHAQTLAARNAVMEFLPDVHYPKPLPPPHEPCHPQNSTISN